MGRAMKGWGIFLFVVVGFLVLIRPVSALTVTDAVSLQLHTPGDDSDLNKTKAQFVMRNDSDPGVHISSILWDPVSPIFFDTAAGAPGIGFSRDFEVSPAQSYTGGTPDPDFTITVLANSDALTGYTGPTTITDGAGSFLLTFNGFDSGEAFGFWSDLDTPSSAVITHTEWDGSTTTIVFDNGCTIHYTWSVPHNPGRTSGVEGTHTACEVDEELPPNIPEPGSLGLLGVGLLGLLKRRRV